MRFGERSIANNTGQDNGYSPLTTLIIPLQQLVCRPTMKKCMVFASDTQVIGMRLISFIPLSTLECNETTRLHNNGGSVYSATKMASGKSNPKYKALLSHSDTLADTLDTNERAKTRLLRKLRANQWIDPKDDLTTDALVALALQKLETEGERVFDQFVGFMSDIAGLTDLATNMRGIVHTTSQTTDKPHPPPPAQHAADHLGPSVESRALRRSNTVFTRGVDPENLVTVLYSNFLLTPEEKARAMKQTLTIGQQLEEIFQSLERRVSTRPQDFKKIIHALMAEPALKAVGDEMQGEFNYVKSPSVHSLMSLQKFMTRNVQDSRNHEQQCVCAYITPLILYHVRLSLLTLTMQL